VRLEVANSVHDDLAQDYVLLLRSARHPSSPKAVPKRKVEGGDSYTLRRSMAWS
jgi:hypothetical protein